ncbi:acetylornithine deacetylase [Paraburkholderia silvatlantica]|uniref:Acetylornithine deacetylase n=1 Tax=Paraburkholderia silvatlantica TaxID=321895 RepID=A0ABR6FZS5_9BURK|nr:acetylornithine deacetylase [Paraburkholderia silvatlantica]MBB2932945.1 acetylornithine deacetylase [Paraburkholderia silvatlantica]PVY16811.1 acetylornithine deacetylase [Paraburkholderia silvatlantica]PXW23502.1 acetylornithine deacetylase [Paraburkholderia silvatlantica]
MPLSRSAELLKTLIAFPTISRTPNLALIEHVAGLLGAAGISSTIVRNDAGTCANLFASTGPADVPGVMLSGHTDVVPVEGQPWTMPPFEATPRDGRLYGRGTADMKGFVACAVIAMIDAAARTLKKPLQLALSYDEEIGCVGVRRLIDVLETAPVRPELCIIGEPTMMQIATGHKGKAAYRAVCRAEEGHSALAPKYLNAIHVAADWIAGIRAAQQHLAESGAHDDGYDVPYSTIHVGTIHGGKALNIVPNACTLEFEIRTLASDNADAILVDIRSRASIASASAFHGKVHLPAVEEINTYPGLDTHVASDAVRFLETLLPPDTQKRKVAFGTEGGLFSTRLSVPTVVCGPGDIGVAHKPDEYVALAQLDACDNFLAQLTSCLQ